MRAILLLTFLIAVPDRHEPTPKQAQTLAEQILGDWQFEKIDFGAGFPAQPMEMETRVLTFTRTETLVTVNRTQRPEEGGAYRLDVAKNPVAIDLVSKNQPNKTVQGIVKLEGDRLILCFAIDGKRPTVFNPSTQNLTAVLYLKRIQK